MEEVATEVGALIAKTAPDNQDRWLMPTRLERAAQDSLQLVCEVPIYSLDPLVRRASALQQTLESAAGGALHINQALADALGLSAGDTAALGQNGSTIQLPLQIDARVPVGCVWLQGAHAALGLECGFGPVTLGMLNG